MSAVPGATAKAEHVPGILRVLRTLDGYVRRGEIVLLVTTLLTMISLAFATVVMRKLRPYFPSIQEVGWFDITARYLVLWVAILGASIAAREGRHFGVEILPKLFSERGRRRLEAVLNLASALLMTLITLLMYRYVTLCPVQNLFVIDGIQIANTTEAGTHALAVDRRWLLAIMPLGLALMTARFFLRSLEATLLSDEQWHHWERELKPDLVAAPVPGAEPASLGSGAVVEAATPPAIAREQEREAHEATERAEKPFLVPPPTAQAPAPKATPEPTPPVGERLHSSTDKVKTYRLGDLGDIEDPEPGPAGAHPPDAEESLVDSDMTAAEATREDDSEAPTERAPKPSPEPPKPSPPGDKPEEKRS
jgi:TRAP-type C4-dicarboxylate transport system permease small subunit